MSAGHDATLMDTSRAPPRVSDPKATQPQGGTLSLAARTTVLPRVALQGEAPELVRDDRARFELARELGRGAVGEVILARDNDINRPVAIKRLLPEYVDADVIARFVEEIRMLGALDHPNIVPVHDVGIDPDGRFFYVMKYVEGETLEHVISRLAEGDPEYHRRYSLARRVDMFRQILRGVQYAHARGVIHRDIKPANIMVGSYGEVVVMDWGLARSIRGRDEAVKFPVSDAAATLSQAPGRGPARLQTVTGSLLGTPAYMSPEQARGENDTLDERSDIYTLCVMFHELLTLKHYLAGRNAIATCLAGVLRDGVPFAHFVSNPHQPAVPPDLSHFIRHGVAKDPAERYRSVTEMLERLELIEDGHCPVECPSTLTKRVSTELANAIDHRPMIVMGGALASMALAAVGISTLLSRWM